MYEVYRSEVLGCHEVWLAYMPAFCPADMAPCDLQGMSHTDDFPAQRLQCLCNMECIAMLQCPGSILGAHHREVAELATCTGRLHKAP